MEVNVLRPVPYIPLASRVIALGLKPMPATAANNFLSNNSVRGGRTGPLTLSSRAVKLTRVLASSLRVLVALVDPL